MSDQDALSTQQEDTRHGAAGSASGFAAGDQVVGRYVVDGPLGRGSSGEVLSVTDLSLDRSVAMKVLRGAGGPVIARFMREARMTARIDHPNVPPVHLLEFLPDGGVLFTMRRLDGASLGEALRRRADGEAVPALATVNAIVQIVQRVCDALARAHALGIIHRDVKPDNIMLGAHGDVALVDWGECRLLSEPDGGPAGSTVGTPAYMSPEQARGEAADQRSDLYALGATLFHALTGRLPTWDPDPERFWERKRRGELDPLPAEVEAAQPRQLLAIARRAMAPLAADRYASAAEVAADLDRFQSGLAVAAYRETALERAARWLHRHRGALVAAAMVLAALTVGGLLAWRERQRSLAGWGEPVLIEDFADDSWRERWVEADPGNMVRQGAELVSQGPVHHFLVLRQAFTGAVAIEYDGRFLPGARPGDLSVIWSEAPTAEEAADDTWRRAQWRGFWLQAGAYDNHFCAIYRRNAGKRLDQAPLRLDPARTHRFRVELDGRSLRMLVDGREVTRAEEPLPIGTGRIGFYAYYPGKAFSNIRIYRRNVAELQPATAIGDAFLQLGRYPDAAVAYQRVVDSLAGTDLAEEARYRQGLAWRLADEPGRAEAAWSSLSDPRQRARAAIHRLDDLVKAERVGDACAALAGILRERPSLRFEGRTAWQAWAGKSLNEAWCHHRMADVERLIAVKLDVFPDDRGSDWELADMLRSIGRHGEVARLLPDEVSQFTVSMAALGRSAECLERLPGYPLAQRTAELETGSFASLIAREPPSQFDRVRAMCWSGRTAEALREVPGQEWPLLWSTPAELLTGPEQVESVRMCALLGLRRWDEAFAVLPASKDRDLNEYGAMLAGRKDPLGLGLNLANELQPWVMVELAARGEAAELARQRADLARVWPDWTRWLAWLVVEPSLAPPDERRALLRARLPIATANRLTRAQRPWHVAGLALGQLDEAAFARMPTSAEVPLWNCVARALRAELAGDDAAVRAAWTDYLALPSHRRLSEHPVPHPCLERLARYKTEGK